eukprot:1139077-Pelagomonas_calceolata.AAC.14
MAGRHVLVVLGHASAQASMPAGMYWLHWATPVPKPACRQACTGRAGPRQCPSQHAGRYALLTANLEKPK